MGNRRQFLERSAAAIATAAVGAPAAFAQGFDPSSWSSVRDQFLLDDGVTNLTTLLLASHPKPVRDAIELHRRGLDADAKRYLDDKEGSAERDVRVAAAAYLGVAADEIALTDSTTMGLGLVYGGLRLRPGQEILTTTHDFYSTHVRARRRWGRSWPRFSAQCDPRRGPSRSRGSTRARA